MTRNRPAHQHRPANSRAFRWARILIGAGLILLLLWLILSTLRLFRAGRSLLEQQQRLETLLDAGILDADPNELEHIVVTVRNDVSEIKSVGEPFSYAGAYLGWLPGFGPVLADARHLLDMADAGSEMALYGVAALKPALASAQDVDSTRTPSLPWLLALLDTAGPHLHDADLAAERLFEARAALQHEDEYPDRLLAVLGRLDENAGLLRDALKLAQAGPELLGQDRPKTYLILAQNEDELRPTGGFISGAGLFTVDRGHIIDLTFDNANSIDDWQNKPYDLPPEPFSEFMGMDIFLFRDANFWPDFAQSASQASALYSYGQDVNVDGVLAIDQQFLRQLLAATGPLTVPELDRIVNAASVVAQLREEWGPGGGGENWIMDRKAFMAPLAGALRNQIESGLLSVNGYDLAEMLQSSAQERHLQLYSADPAVAGLLAETAWSGRMDPGDAGDFLHVSDTNMGFNKVNAVVDRSLAYHVTLDPTGGHSAQLNVHYNNPAATEPVECHHGTHYGADTQYDSLTSDCYWNYLRVYVPGGSVLNWSSKHPVPAANLMSGIDWPGVSRSRISENGSYTVFDNFILLGTGQEVTVSFDYALPDAVLIADGKQYNYRLHVRKQAGTTAESISISVSVPTNSQVLAARPKPTATNGNSLQFDLELTSDVTIEVAFRK